MGLRDWLLSQGAAARDRAQHNARALAVRRGLMTEEDASRPSRLLPPMEMESQTAGGGSMGALQPVALAAALEQVPPIQKPTINPITGRPVRETDIDLPYEEMPEEAAEPTFEDIPLAEPEPEPMIQVRGGTGAPVTSKSDYFGGLDATFAPGTQLYGRGDPIRDAEQRALTAKIRDYNWRTGILQNAAQLPEGPMRELWRDNPGVAGRTQTDLTNALLSGFRELGSAPDTMLPSEAAERDAVSQARGALAAGPMIDARKLEEILAQAGRRLEPTVLDTPVAEAEAGAAGRLRGRQRELEDLLHRRNLEVAAARGNLFGMTPGQELGIAGEPDEGMGDEPSAGQAAPPAQPQQPAQPPGANRQIPWPNVVALASKAGMSPEQMAEVLTQKYGFTIQR